MAKLEVLSHLSKNSQELTNNMKGVIWLFSNIIGISYELLPKNPGIKVCLRILALDYLCTELGQNKLSVDFDINLYMVRAKMTVGLKENCLFWEGLASHRFSGYHETTDGGKIICFGPMKHLPKKEIVGLP